jgi:polysaccharide export outer membrane protein
MRQFVFVLVGLILAATAVAAQDGYRIRPGDILRVEVLEDPGLNRNALVLPDGRISFPLAGTVQAGGRTVEQIQADLASKLTPNFATTPTVFISIDTLSPPAAPRGGVAVARTIDVYVLGEAAKPGKYQVAAGTTLLQFLAESGGFSQFAATRRIQLRRVDASGTEKVYTFNYKTMEAGAVAGGSTVIADGDVIVIPQRRLFE